MNQKREEEGKKRILSRNFLFTVNVTKKHFHPIEFRATQERKRRKNLDEVYEDKSTRWNVIVSITQNGYEELRLFLNLIK